ncbi:MAG TPA: ABC transporter ATP-binding protein [Sedimenticola sp.]|nr:ABC transporter ATP-binding protein [Sedimenticola sp.]
MQDSSVPKLLKHFVATYPVRTATIVVLLSVAGLAEGISVMALLPFVELAIGGHQAESGGVGDVVSRLAGTLGVNPSLGGLLILIVAGIAAKAAITLVAMKEVGYAVGRMMTDLRRRLISSLMAARWSYFVARPLGTFANAIGAETIRAGATYQQAARLAAAAVQAAVYGVVTVLVSWKAALFAILAGLFGAAVFHRVVAAAMRSGERQTALMRSLAVRTTDTLQGIKPIKAMAAEESAVPLLDHEIQELDDAQRDQVWSAELLRVAQEPLLVLLLALGIYGAVEIGGESLPALMVVAVLFYRLFNRFQVMQEIYQQIGTGASAYWSVYRLCGEAEREGERCSGGGIPIGRVPRIELDAVTYAYDNNDVLRDLSLSIEPGEFVAVTGTSGGGKTTLLDIVSGLLSPRTGCVRLDDRDLGDLDLKSWRGKIGYVPQEMLLLHDSIFRNVSLGDETISRTKAEAALRAAGVWEVVSALPEGMDTVIGERGSRFSGGQRQRISLARALAREPALLLLDEITAALDEETERGVCATLRRLAGKMTIIAVSHQPEMARVADRVIRLEAGRLDSPMIGPSTSCTGITHAK